MFNMQRLEVVLFDFFFYYFEILKYMESNNMVQLNNVPFPGLNNNGILRFRCVPVFLSRNRNVIWKSINKT